MTTANKAVDLSSYGSDNEELPADLGPTASSNSDDLTASSSVSYSLPDRTVSHQSVPASPRSAKKRAYNAIYAEPESPITSTTPAKPPPRSMSMSVSRQSHNMDKAKTFEEEIKDYQQQLEAEFKKFELSLVEHGTAQPLDDMDWDELEMQYRQEVSRLDEEEIRLMEGIEARFQQFLLWMQVSREKESERAIKRLKTRAAFVQNSERRLLQKQDHFQKVLEAFQSAMSLLANG